jgi:predicted phage terminase large subunit-like protein
MPRPKDPTPPLSLTEEQRLEQMLASSYANPEAAMRLLDQADSEESLLSFIQLMWHVLEPGRQFVTGWVVEAICEHLEAVSRGEIKKLLINVPPGCMKSLTTNVFWPAWEWGPRNRPDLRYIGASYSENLTIRDNRRCRALITDPLYQAFWGSRYQLSEGQNAKMRFDTDRTGFKIATSVSGMGTGERGDRFIIDDPHNVLEGESEAKRENVLQWFTEVVPTRINDPAKSALVVIMQRVHDRDVSGLILEKELGYDHLCIPMEYESDHPHLSRTKTGWKDPRKTEGENAWPERFSKDYLESDLKPSLRAWGGTYAEAGQLQQRPAPRGGGMFKRDDFQFVDAPPAKVHARVRAWDLAATDEGTNARAARTAGAKVSLGMDGALYIEHVVKGQWSPGVVEDELKKWARIDGRAVKIDFPQDPGQAGKAQKAYLYRALNGYSVYASPETGSKEDRARPFAAQVEAKNVYLVRGAWNDSFLAEATTFPMGQFKDQIDAVSRAHARLIQKRERRIGVAPVVVDGAKEI